MDMKLISISITGEKNENGDDFLLYIIYKSCSSGSPIGNFWVFIAETILDQSFIHSLLNNSVLYPISCTAIISFPIL